MSLLKAFPSCHTLKSHPKPTPHQPEYPRLRNFSRRFTVSLLAAQLLFGSQASSFALDQIAKGRSSQTLEEAEKGLRDHSRALLNVKTLIESGAWSEAQRELRKSSSNMKQDMYTIIQGKPGDERPELRRLYSDLFNNVSRMVYASRDKDEDKVWQYYRKIVGLLDDIFSRV